MSRSPEAREWRDIWSVGGAAALSDLLSSCMATLLMSRPTRPAYFASPFITDFPLFDNRFGAYGVFFPEFADASEIRLTQFLARLATLTEVRIMTTRTKQSAEFVSNEFIRGSRVHVKFAAEITHEKGILAQDFYLEGSMNLTYKGVYINGEKVMYYASGSPNGNEKIARAYLEFDRKWQNLP
jgi:hypothetical protein